MLVLGLGSNKGDRINNLRTALSNIRLVDEIKIIQISPLYKSDAMLPENAPKDWDQFYLNVAISCETTLEPIALLNILQKIEAKLGREKPYLQWSPRTIDIDIMAWKGKQVKTNELTIPHAELHKRPFALLPFLDITLNWQSYIGEQDIISSIKENLEKWRIGTDDNIPFNTTRIAHRIDVPYLMGIVNVTPDSFSDGNKNLIEHAMEHAIEYSLERTIVLFDNGADIIDIGAESTRPGATAISPEMEWERLWPTLQVIMSYWNDNVWRPRISIDTRHYEVAEKAILYGVDFINDVSGFTNPKMCKIVAEADIHAIYMHNLGLPANSNNCISLDKDPIREVFDWAVARKEDILQAGIKPEKLIFDPGIGFGKDAEQSLQLLKRINEFHALNIPLLVGHSRKSFFNMCTKLPFTERDPETAVVSEFLARNSVQYLRVHNIEHNMRNLRMQTFLL